MTEATEQVQEQTQQQLSLEELVALGNLVTDWKFKVSKHETQETSLEVVTTLVSSQSLLDQSYTNYTHSYIGFVNNPQSSQISITVYQIDKSSPPGNISKTILYGITARLHQIVLGEVHLPFSSKDNSNCVRDLYEKAKSDYTKRSEECYKVTRFNDPQRKEFGITKAREILQAQPTTTQQEGGSKE